MSRRSKEEYLSKKVACLTLGRQKRKEKIPTAMVTFKYESTGLKCFGCFVACASHKTKTPQSKNALQGI